MPNLDAMVVNELPCGLNGRGVTRAIQVDHVFEMAVGANDVSSIVGRRRSSLARCLEAGGIEPFIDVSGGVDLLGLLEEAVPLWSWL